MEEQQDFGLDPGCLLCLAQHCPLTAIRPLVIHGLLATKEGQESQPASPGPSRALHSSSLLGKAWGLPPSHGAHSSSNPRAVRPASVFCPIESPALLLRATRHVTPCSLRPRIAVLSGSFPLWFYSPIEVVVCASRSHASEKKFM